MIAAGENDTLNARKPRRFQHVEQTARIHAEQLLESIATDHAGEMNRRPDIAHHAFDGRTVSNIGDDRLLIVGEVVHRFDVGQPQVAPARTKAGTQRRADGPGSTRDQHAVGLWVDHDGTVPPALFGRSHSDYSHVRRLNQPLIEPAEGSRAINQMHLDDPVTSCAPKRPGRAFVAYSPD